MPSCGVPPVSMDYHDEEKRIGEKIALDVIVLLKLATDIHEASSGLSATAGLLVHCANHDRNVFM